MGTSGLAFNGSTIVTLTGVASLETIPLTDGGSAAIVGAQRTVSFAGECAIPRGFAGS